MLRNSWRPANDLKICGLAGEDSCLVYVGSELTPSFGRLVALAGIVSRCITFWLAASVAGHTSLHFILDKFYQVDKCLVGN